MLSIINVFVPLRGNYSLQGSCTFIFALMRQIQRAPGVSLYNAYFSSPFNHVCFLQPHNTSGSMKSRTELHITEVFQKSPSVRLVVSYIHRGTVTKSRRLFTKNI